MQEIKLKNALNKCYNWLKANDLIPSNLLKPSDNQTKNYVRNLGTLRGRQQGSVRTIFLIARKYQDQLETKNCFRGLRLDELKSSFPVLFGIHILFLDIWYEFPNK